MTNSVTHKYLMKAQKEAKLQSKPSIRYKVQWKNKRRQVSSQYVKTFNKAMLMANKCFGKIEIQILNIENKWHTIYFLVRWENQQKVSNSVISSLHDITILLSDYQGEVIKKGYYHGNKLIPVNIPFALT